MTLTRRENGDVVLNSGDSDILFDVRYGGSPLEFWRHNYPGPITNRFPGSGASVVFDTGQDPTQASANGFTPNPICRFGAPETDRFNYYIRETRFEQPGIYEVSGFVPDFWLSHESIDDYPCPPAFGWSAINTALVFSGSPAHSSSIYCPGNEMEPGRIRRYPKGRIAFKTRIAMKCDSGIGGFMFRKAVASDTPTATEFYDADGYHVNFMRSGQWQILQQKSRVQTSVASGLLSNTERAKLIAGGLLVEIRTSNVDPSIVEFYLEGAIKKTMSLGFPVLGDAFGVFANCIAGTIGFTERQVFDLGVQVKTRWESLNGGRFRQTVTIDALEPRRFYRANTPAVFLNKELFTDRSCQVMPWGQDWRPGPGTYKFGDCAAYWCGNVQGTLGVMLSDIIATVDGQVSAGAHLLLRKSADNDEFILHVNPLSEFPGNECQHIFFEGAWRFTR